MDARRNTRGKKTSDLSRSALRRLALPLSTTSYRGTHDDIGGGAKIMMRKGDVYGNFCTSDSRQAYDFLKSKFDTKEKDSKSCFSGWSPYTFTRSHVEDSTPRPVIDMTGIKGTLSNYQFTGDFHLEPGNPEMNDPSTRIDSGGEGYSLGTTDSVIVDRLKPHRENIRTKLTVGVRKASCFWSSCKDQRWSYCFVARRFLQLVGKMKREKESGCVEPQVFDRY